MPLGVKILLLIFFCLTSGFGGYVIYSLKSETQALLKQHRQRSHLFSETMISGNIRGMFEDMDEVSSDRIDFGSGILPWISFKGITVS